ncbi:MAG: hypothetical protein R2741_14170 [Methanolobus sp.]
MPDLKPEWEWWQVLFTSKETFNISGNIVELEPDVSGYRKFRSITDILCNGTGEDKLLANDFDEAEKNLVLNDGISRSCCSKMPLQCNGRY